MTDRKSSDSFPELACRKDVRESGKAQYGPQGQSVVVHNPFRGLLETLQNQVGCVYLSDLHIPSNLPVIQWALRKIQPDSYDLREWNDAICYITGRQSHFDSPKEAAAYLKSWNPETPGRGWENCI